MIADAVLDGGEQAELPLKAENVPRIDECAAFDRTMQKLVDLGQHAASMFQFVAINVMMSGSQSAVNLAEHPSGSHRHDPRLPTARFCVTHSRKNLGQVDVLQLH